MSPGKSILFPNSLCPATCFEIPKHVLVPAAQYDTVSVGKAHHLHLPKCYRTGTLLINPENLLQTWTLKGNEGDDDDV